MLRNQGNNPLWRTIDWRARQRAVQNQHPLRGAFGALLGISACATVAWVMAGITFEQVYLIAPMGASAVLAFAVPASPLAQPRSILGGNIVSGLVGLTVARLVPWPMPCAAVAVAVAILAMQHLRCIHPPGGAVALVTAMGGHPGAPLPWHFLLAPVALNSLTLVGAAVLYNNLSGSRYPHRPEVLPEHRLPLPPTYSRADLEAVLDEMEDQPDIAIDDLDAILRAVETRARSGGAAS